MLFLAVVLLVFILREFSELPDIALGKFSSSKLHLLLHSLSFLGIPTTHLDSHSLRFPTLFGSSVLSVLLSRIYLWIFFDSITLLELHTQSGMLAALLLGLSISKLILVFEIQFVSTPISLPCRICFWCWYICWNSFWTFVWFVIFLLKFRCLMFKLKDALKAPPALWWGFYLMNLVFGLSLLTPYM